MTEQQSDQTSIDREIERDYVLERLSEIRSMVHELLEGVELGRYEHIPDGGLSGLEGIALACYSAEDRWSR